MQQFPRWLSWIVVIGLAYILYVGNTRDDVPTPPRETETTNEAPKEYKELRALLDGERWKKAIDPTYVSPDDACAPRPKEEGRIGSYAILLDASDYEPAKCGDDLALIIEQVLPSGKIKAGEAMGYTLGLQPEFDALIVGMRPAEERLVIFTPSKSIKALPFAKPGTLQVLHVTYPLDVIE